MSVRIRGAKSGKHYGHAVRGQLPNLMPKHADFVSKFGKFSFQRFFNLRKVANLSHLFEGFYFIRTVGVLPGRNSFSRRLSIFWTLMAI